MTDVESKEQIYADVRPLCAYQKQALAQAGVLKHWLDTQKADRDVALATQRELRLSYSMLIQQLIEKANVREAEQKAQIAAVEGENRRLKVLVDGVSTLEFQFLEARALVLQMQENEDRLLKELRKSQREALEAKARYEALVTHSEHKLNEANIEVQRLTESYANENATLKAKLARFESTTGALQQTVSSKDKEIAQLRSNVEQMMDRLAKAGM